MELIASTRFFWVAIFNLIVGSGRFGMDYLIKNEIKTSNKRTITPCIYRKFRPKNVQENGNKYSRYFGNKKNTKIGIRGNDKQLSWDYATEMKAIKKESLHQIALPRQTGDKFTEVKFTINGNL